MRIGCRLSSGRALALALLLAQPPAVAARLAVGSASGLPGGTATVTITFATEGAAVAALEADLLLSGPLSLAGFAAGPAALAALKAVGVTPVSGGYRLQVFGLNTAALSDGALATITFAVGIGAPPSSYLISAGPASAASPTGAAVGLTVSSGVVTVGTGSSGPFAWILPSSARAAGSGGAFYTTDLTLVNSGPVAASITVKFLGNGGDGRGGAEKSVALGAGKAVTYADVLGTLFELTSGFGAIQVRSSVATLTVLGQTSTPGSGGTFGQSVKALGPSDWVGATPRVLAPVREDASFRTNLILANATEASFEVDVTLRDEAGAILGSKRYGLPPLGMIQVTRVIRDVGETGDVAGAWLSLSTPAAGGLFAAYASVIDNATNDPRTLLPQ